jgi:hypothetical protein
VSTSTVRIARVRHRCVTRAYDCTGWIEPGERYRFMTVFPNDDAGHPEHPVSGAECGRCADYYLRDGWATDSETARDRQALAAAIPKESPC